MHNAAFGISKSWVIHSNCVGLDAEMHGNWYESHGVRSIRYLVSTRQIPRSSHRLFKLLSPKAAPGNASRCWLEILKLGKEGNETLKTSWTRAKPVLLDMVWQICNYSEMPPP